MMRNGKSRDVLLKVFYKYLREFNDILMEKNGDSKDQIFNLKVLLFDLENELKKSFDNWLSVSVFPSSKFTSQKELFFTADILNIKVNYCLN